MSLHWTCWGPLELICSKHDTCSKEETDYIAQLFAIATNSDVMSEVKYHNLVDLAKRYYKQKILSRHAQDRWFFNE